MVTRNGEINSDYMKIIVASYYRFKRQYKYTCTEFEFMDICACNASTMIEVECKISKSDLKKEFKKPKHNKYRQASKTRDFKGMIPNRYFVAITTRLSQDLEVLDLINKLNPKYGIMVVDDLDHYNGPVIIKQAKKLHDKEPDTKTMEYIVARLSSENIGLREKVYKLKNKKAQK